MSNEPNVPTYFYIKITGVFYKNKQALSMNNVCEELNRLDSEIDRLIIKKKLQYDEFRSERNAMQDKISALESELERLTKELHSCQSERLSAEEVKPFAIWVFHNHSIAYVELTCIPNKLTELIAAWRKSKST